MKKIFTNLIFALVISSAATAQTVSGKIEDAASNNAVANATVKLSSIDSTKSSLFSVSNSQGVFVFNDVADGSYTLTITSIGYGEVNKQVSVIGQNASL